MPLRPAAQTELSMSIPICSNERAKLKRILVTGVQLWPTQLYCSLNIKYRSTESAAESMRKVGRPKFAPEIAS
jgi:hypothetical protein